ncbi:hypothetical protein Hanom_Chr09g00770331 [Helianthus anomalus]
MNNVMRKILTKMMKVKMKRDEQDEASSKFCNRVKSKPWTHVQEVALVKTWCYASNNNTKGNQQPSENLGK